MQDDEAASGSISLDQLRTLRAVAAARTLTRAAESLYITQPAVTHRIRRLEEALGVELFRRACSGRELELSEAGERALRFAEDVARLVVDFRSDLATLGLAACDRAISIASSESLLLPFLVSAFHQRHPHVDVRVTQCPCSEVVRAVAEGSSDLGFEFSSAPDDGFYRVPILQDRVVLVASGDEMISEDPAENLRRVGRMSFLLPSSGKHCREVAEDWAQAHQVHLRVALESHSYGVLLKAVGHHFGVAVMPERLIARRLALGELRTVPMPGFPHDFQISVIAARPPQASLPAGLVRAFLQLARDPAWRAPLPPELASVEYATATVHPSTGSG